jgi:hypothetical protein
MIFQLLKSRFQKRDLKSRFQKRDLKSRFQKRDLANTIFKQRQKEPCFKGFAKSFSQQLATFAISLSDCR